MRLTWTMVLAAALLISCGSAWSQTMVFPGAQWATATPASQGVDADKMTAALNYLSANVGSQGVQQMVIVRNGYLIWSGNDVDNRHNVWSASKSFTSTVLGLLIDDGKATLNTRAKDYVPGLAAQYSNVTLRHFATMTSGYNAVGGAQSGTPFDPASPLFAPGAEFRYWDAAMNQFANVLTRIADEPIKDLFKRRIADPIGIPSSAWSWGDWGSIDGLLVNGGAGNKTRGISITARAMARFGHLFLNEGNWNGTQLLSAEWVRQASSVQVPASVTGSDGDYGFNWWLTTDWKNAPAGTYYAAGYNNNKCFVIPEWDMVIVRLGTDGNVDDAVWDNFMGKLGEGVTVVPEPASLSLLGLGAAGAVLRQNRKK